MASSFGQRKVRRRQEYSATDQLLHEPNPLKNYRHSASWWADEDVHREQGDSLREQLKELDDHVARLQDMLRSERCKCSKLQLRCNQQEAELRRRELNMSRLKEKLSQMTDRHREKRPSIEVLNFPPGGRGKREKPSRVLGFTSKQEEAALRLMLERREAELREAMKLRHSLTTLLHALRVDMEQFLSDRVDVSPDEDKRLDRTEAGLGEHVTGGVIQSWRQVQKKLQNVLSNGLTTAGTDQEKLLVQLETELQETQQLVRVQQQLFQDSVSSEVSSELSESYYLEEWERLQMCWAELNHQRRTFERERQAFTDAAIRLSYERRDFEQRKASLVKQHYLCDSPLFGTGSPALVLPGVEPADVSGCLPITPSSTESENTGVSGLCEGRARVRTPSTAELYSALNLSYGCRSDQLDQPSDTWDGRVDNRVHTPWPPHLDWSV
ncbi:afadin- and alpha-actinin-binding protein B [Cololabis saira]|uniref:afadin- and alpha-actinin-binding protein B n=1 Tax=Cololabis saira TaxID=129043 RepID=UPI002AD4F2B3|nr:afadin- and alpha-actinin-binding protein B [Cololabis saira]XP_061576636.1 afadin- and alpha-actinin-binding protein B [Cololabis saira]